MNKMILLLSLLALISCGKEPAKKSSSSKQNVSAYYSASSLTLKVFYEPGAEPYTQESLFSYWTITEQNLKALFSGRSPTPTIVVPKTLSDMKPLPVSSKTSWSADDVLELSKRTQTNSDPHTFEIYFLNGYSSDGASVIGFHISNTRVMAIFKDVIRSTGAGILEAAVPKYVEQATIVHEMGHALGLVNNGAPMKEGHEDSINKHHCSNASCVMYHANEGISGLMRLAQQAIAEGNIIMFDDKCLQDSRSYKP